MQKEMTYLMMVYMVYVIAMSGGKSNHTPQSNLIINELAINVWYFYLDRIGYPYTRKYYK